MLEPIARKTEEQCLSHALDEKDEATVEDMAFVREGAEPYAIKKQKLEGEAGQKIKTAG